MNDVPNAYDLLRAVEEYLVSEVSDTAVTHRDRYRSRVAASAIQLAVAELQAPDRRLSELQAISELLGEDVSNFRGSSMDARVVAANEALKSAIRAGSFDDRGQWTRALDLAMSLVATKLKLTDPGSRDELPVI